MGISEIYGVDEPAPPRAASATPDIPATSVASDPGIEEQPPSQEHSAIDSHPRQTTVEPQAVPPSHAAVAEIERFLAAGQHPVDTAAPFLTGTDHTSRPRLGGRPRSAPAVGAFGACLAAFWAQARHAATIRLAPTRTMHRAPIDGDEGDSGAGRRPRMPHPDGQDTAGGDQPAARDGRSWPLQTRHVIIAAVFTVVVLLAAVMIGRSAQPDTAAPAAATPAPAAAAAQAARDAPISNRYGDGGQCGAGSTDPTAAFGATDPPHGNAWRHITGVGQVLTIMLPKATVRHHRYQCPTGL